LSDERQVKTTQKDIPHYPFVNHNLEYPAEFEHLRQTCPVARVAMPYGGEAVLLTRYADIVKGFTDPGCAMIQRSDGDVPRLEAGEVTGAEPEGQSLFTVSDERHNKVRRLTTQAFTVKHANALRPRVVEVTNELIDAMERSGSPADLFEDYAIQTPMTVICELLGVPREKEKLYRETARIMLSVKATPQEMQEQRMRMIQYLTPIIEQAQARPGNNVLGLLVKASQQGDAVITIPELFSFAMGLIVAGFETVSTTFTNSAFILLQHPELIARLKDLVDDQDRMARAVEEILRITSIGPGRPRITRGAVQFSDTTVPEGEVIILPPDAANHDEVVFPHPFEVDFERNPNPIITFGRGIHACLGQQIARMELQVLWNTLLKRLPTVHLAVAPSEVPWRTGETLTFGPAHLPIAW
jgi:cytochrome P450